MLLKDILEEVTPEQMEQRQYDDGYDAGAVDVRSGRPHRFDRRMPRTTFERGYLAGYERLAAKRAKRDDVHDDMPLAAETL